MKSIFYLMILLVSTSFIASAQEKLDRGSMHYIYNAKPNNILYHDSLFRGSAQFKELFYRQGNATLIRLYEKHQANKIAGGIIGIVGTFATAFGISMLSSSGDNKAVGWALAGGGFAVTVTGGYLVFMGQQNLQMAVALFNQQNRNAALGIGVGNRQTGLVYRF